VTGGDGLYVFAGGPGTGKTTLLTALESRGYVCLPDNARAVIQQRLAAGLSPRPDPGTFARTILEADVAAYRAGARAERPVFFDRGIIDAVGGLYLAGRLSDAEVDEYLVDYPYDRSVFLFPPWEEIYVNDEERDQSFSEAVDVYERSGDWYRRCGYQTIEVPREDLSTRLRFIERWITPAR